MPNESAFPYSFLVYAVADGRAGSPIAPLDLPIYSQLRELANVLSSPRLAGAFQVDPSSGNTVRDVFLPRNHQAFGRYRQDLDETNSADVAVLTEFVAWARDTIPSRHTILALSSHGLAWQDRVASDALSTRGLVTRISRNPSDAISHPRRLFSNRRVAYQAAIDSVNGIKLGLGSRVVDTTKAILLDGSSSDFMSVSELNSALASVASTLQRKIDVLVFDACLMSTIEQVFEVCPYTNAVVAAIDELSSAGMNLSLAAKQLDALLSSSDDLGDSASRVFVESYVPSQNFDSCIAVSCDEAKWSECIRAFRDFVNEFDSELKSGGDTARALFSKVLRQTALLTKYRAGSLADIGIILKSLKDVGGDSFPKSVLSLQTAVSLIRDCVIAKKAGSDYASDDIIGLSLYCPISKEEVAYNNFDYQRLRFSTSTGWGTLLSTAFN